MAWIDDWIFRWMPKTEIESVLYMLWLNSIIVFAFFAFSINSAYQFFWNGHNMTYLISIFLTTAFGLLYLPTVKNTWNHYNHLRSKKSVGEMAKILGVTPEELEGELSKK